MADGQDWIDASNGRLAISRAIREDLTARRYAEARVKLAKWEAEMAKCAIVPLPESLSFHAVGALLELMSEAN